MERVVTLNAAMGRRVQVVGVESKFQTIKNPRVRAVYFLIDSIVNQ